MTRPISFFMALLLLILCLVVLSVTVRIASAASFPHIMVEPSEEPIVHFTPRPIYRPVFMRRFVWVPVAPGSHSYYRCDTTTNPRHCH